MINIPLTSTFKNTGFKQAEKSISTLDKSANRLAMTLAGAFSVRKLAQFTRTTIMSASNLEEAMSKVNVVFGMGASQVEAFGKSSAANLGISSSAALEAAGTYGNLLQAFGLGQRQAQDMSMALVQLAADMASFNNTSIDQAITALRSGLSGETEPLKRFGVALTDARLRTEALSLGLVKNTKEALGPAIKAQAAYSLIMKDTTLAQGDFARTSGGVANSLKILAAAAENSRAIIGEGLIRSMDMLVDRQDGVQGVANVFEGMATNVSNATVGLASLIANVKTLGGLLPEGRSLSLNGFNPNIPGLQAFKFLVERGEKLTQEQKLANIGFGNRQSARVAEMESARILKEWKKQQKAVEKLRKEEEKKAKAAKEARLEAERRRKILEKLSKAGDILDTEKASVEAALQNASLSENEILRLKLKKAILNENADRALALADELQKSQDQLGKLRDLSMTFKPTNPFQPWLDAIDELNRKISLMGNVPQQSMAQGDAARALINLGETTGNQGLFDQGLNMLNQWLSAGIDETTLAGLQTERDAQLAAMNEAKVQAMVPKVEVYVSGVGGLDDQAKRDVVDAVVEASSRGYGTGWFRTTDVYAI